MLWRLLFVWEFCRLGNPSATNYHFSAGPLFASSSFTRVQLYRLLDPCVLLHTLFPGNQITFLQIGKVPKLCRLVALCVPFAIAIVLGLR